MNASHLYFSDDEEEQKKPAMSSKSRQKNAMSRWRAANREHLLESMRDYYRRNADRIREQRRERYHNKERERLREKVKCPVCRVTVQRSSLHNHNKSRLHRSMAD